MTIDYDTIPFSMKFYAWSMVVCFPIGVPSTFFVLLHSRREEIEERETRLGGPSLDTIAFFFRFYTPRR